LYELLLNVFFFHVAHILCQQHLKAISDSLPDCLTFSWLSEINHEAVKCRRDEMALSFLVSQDITHTFPIIRG
jgi:hypothetical protein